MKIRSTENPTSFETELFEAMNIHGLQGLTLNSSYEFTAGIEAVVFEPTESTKPEEVFQSKEWITKLSLCKQLSVPLYLVTHKSRTDSISIYKMSEQAQAIQAVLDNEFSPDDFADWWRALKGTVQNKPLYEAGPRVEDSYFDNLLEEHKLAWGGNIDGVILGSVGKPKAIVETRVTSAGLIETYDPARFYLDFMGKAGRLRRGDRNTWEPVVLLASRLGLPLFLLTFEREGDRKRTGFAIIDSVSEEELRYQDTPPNRNIIEGIENIREQLMRNLSRKSPSKL